MQRVQQFCPPRSLPAPAHVLSGHHILVVAAVAVAPKPTSCIIVQEAGTIPKVKNQPEFEARVRDCQVDVVPDCETHGLAEMRVVSRPLDVEDTPDLVDFPALLTRARLKPEGALDERQRHFTAGGPFYPKIDCGYVSDVVFAGQRRNVLRLRALTFTEDNHRLLDLALPNFSGQGSGLQESRTAPTASHQNKLSMLSATSSAKAEAS
jgi:hypothetical protein